MKDQGHRRKRAIWVAIVVICILLVGVGVTQFSIVEMASTSMRPVVSGQGALASKRNDLLVVCRWVRPTSLHSGDLVLVDIPTGSGQVRTIRRIEQQPDTPAGQFYLRAESESGIDSRQVGVLPLQSIRGRVVWILR